MTTEVICMSIALFTMIVRLVIDINRLTDRLNKAEDEIYRLRIIKMDKT